VGLDRAVCPTRLPLPDSLRGDGARADRRPGRRPPEAGGYPATEPISTRPPSPT
jgi:hypothetical protein